MELAFFEQHYPGSRQLSFALTGAGNLALQRGDLQAARQCHERALEIRVRTSPGSELVSESLFFIAETCVTAGELDEAVAYLRRGLENEGGDAASGQDAAQIVSLLGRVAYLRGDFEQSELAQRRAVRLWEEFVGPGTMSSARARLRLAEALQGLDRPVDAFDVSLKCESLRRGYLRTSSRSLTEREALAYGASHGGALDLALTLVADAGNRIPDGNRRAFDAVIRSRAVVLDEIAARHRDLFAGSDPETIGLANEYAAARDTVARLVIQGPTGADPAVYQDDLVAAQAEKDRTERALVARSSEFRRERNRDQAGFDEVARRVSSSGALVAFVRYYRVDPKQSGESSELSWDEGVAEYAAFLLPRGSTDPIMVPLGPAGEIDALVADLRRQISSALIAGPVAGKRTTDQYRSAGARLRERVWDPVAARIGDSSRVFVVADGALNLVDFAALPVEEAQYLVEAGPLIHYLSAERDVLGYEVGPETGGLLALGDPAFDEPSLFAALAPGGVPVKMNETYRLASAATYRGPSSGCSGFRSMHFEPLPATGDEVNEVVTLWLKEGEGSKAEPAKRDDPISLRGAAASEAAFKALAPGMRMIHLATHGFFLGEGCPSAMGGTTRAATGGEAPALAGENPLLLSGFALAGANHRDAAGSDEEDGILTAEEIAALNLTGVQWAVLSGCDTGLGEVRAGEGVLGLRRAFQVAGARTVIMSLWPVEDEMTRLWMKALYDNRFTKGMSTIDAVHEAKLKLLRQRRAAGESTHPFYWAGFIASGDWR
jgi:CHAT domain-containing protein/tetratricopeptide (TPR) repeat protein